MRVPRIHTEQALAAGDRIALESGRGHYIRNVLRLDTGSALVLFNGDGHDYPARIVRAAKKEVTVEVEDVLAESVESPLAVVLGIGISKGERMDYAIQKSTELGVAGIVPLFTEHGDVRLAGERLARKQRHWRGIVISACEQSGRNVLPRLHEAVGLSHWLETLDCPHRMVFDQRAAGRLDTDTAADRTAVLVGPEGGLSEAELAQAERAGFAGIQLGPRVLRTETAPVAVISVLQFLWGDFRA